jgi:hypothetical protein
VSPTEIVANVMQRAKPGAFYERRSSSGSLAKFAAMRRALGIVVGALVFPRELIEWRLVAAGAVAIF